MKWLTVAKVLQIHERSLEESGGDPGIREPALLDSAVAQPRARFGGKDLYPGIADKAAVLAFSLVMNHPFVDGNKRTGYAAMMMFLSRNDHTIITSIDERESIFVSLAAGTLNANSSTLGSVLGPSGRSPENGRAGPDAVPILPRPVRDEQPVPGPLDAERPDHFKRDPGPIRKPDSDFCRQYR